MIGFFFIWLLLAVYSFTRQDLNLVLYNFFPYSRFWDQVYDWLIQLGWYQRPTATAVYIGLSLLLIACYGYCLIKHRYPGWGILFLLAISGIFAYPMFSYDIFNYIFNAKMALIYQVNPHLQAAVEFSRDPMLRFMQNVHTPAPYGYGWTILSLIPGLAWFSGKFTLAFWAMKAFIVAFWLGQLWITRKLVTKLFPGESWRFWLFALNPLVLVETLINGHNDVVMMFLALGAFWSGSLLLLLLSASIKYASIVLLPLNFIKINDIPAWASLFLLVVIFTRPDQLHSWYLIWAFSFAVLAKSKWLVSVFTALTFGALLRYAPFIYYGHWDPPVYYIRNIVWITSLGLIPFIRRFLLK